MSDTGACDGGGAESGTSKSLRSGSSVGELVKTYDDGAGKRDRSESGDSAPMGKRRPPNSSPRQTPGEVREIIEDAVEGLESRLSLFLSREIHKLTDSLLLKFEDFNTRIKDLEEHVNEKDIALEKVSAELQVTQEEVRRLSERNENAEMNSRIPCLVLSGSALAPRRGSHLAAPLPLPADRSAPRGAGSAGQVSGPDGARAVGSGAGGGGGGNNQTIVCVYK